MNKKFVFFLTITFLSVQSSYLFAQDIWKTIANDSEIIRAVNNNYKKKIRKKIFSEHELLIERDSSQIISAYGIIGGIEFFPDGVSDSIKNVWKSQEQVSLYTTFNQENPGLFCFLSTEVNGYQIGEIFLVTNKHKYYRGYECSFISGSTRIQFLIYNKKIIKVQVVNKPNKCFLI